MEKKKKQIFVELKDIPSQKEKIEKRPMSVSKRVKKIFLNSKYFYQILKKNSFTQDEFLEIVLKFFWDNELKIISFSDEGYDDSIFQKDITKCPK